jgi:adenosylhomocysteine nucleosidase
MSPEFGRDAEIDPPDVERVLFCFAVEQEAKFFVQPAREKLVAGIGRENPALRFRAMEKLFTGIGRENAERKLHAKLKQEPYQLVLSCGFAGGLAPYLTTGTVVFSADEDAGLTDALLVAGACPVRFHCSTRVAITVEEKRALRQATGADAVEMESSIIRAICRAHGIPSATIRVISDAADEDLPLDFNALLTSEQELNYPKLVLTLLSSPSKIPALLRLQRQTQLAARRLAEVLVRLIPCGD